MRQALPANPDPTNHHQSLAPRLVVFVEVGDADVWCGGLAVHLHRGESWTTVSVGFGQPIPTSADTLPEELIQASFSKTLNTND